MEHDHDQDNLYRPAEATLSQPDEFSTNNEELPLASRLTRLVSALVGITIYIVAIAPFVYYSYSQGEWENAATEAEITFIIYKAIAIPFLVIGLINLYLLYTNGQTIPKKLLGIKIVCYDNQRASLLRLVFLRYFAPGAISNLPIVGWIFSLANPLFIFGNERRCLHDYIAQTKVVNVTADPRSF